MPKNHLTGATLRQGPPRVWNKTMGLALDNGQGGSCTRMEVGMDEEQGQANLGGWSKSQDQVLDEWLRRLEVEQGGHSRAATRQRFLSAWTAVLIIIISAVVGSTFFRDVSEAGEGSRLFFGVLSLVPGVLTAIQKLLQFSERAEKHALTAQRYRGLRREMQATLATPLQAREAPKGVFQRLQKEFDNIERDAPDLSHAARSQLERQYGVWSPDRGMRKPSLQ
jgi:hypothetical protein